MHLITIYIIILLTTSNRIKYFQNDLSNMTLYEVNVDEMNNKIIEKNSRVMDMSICENRINCTT